MSKKHILRPDGYEPPGHKPYKDLNYNKPYATWVAELTSTPNRPYRGRLKKRQYKKWSGGWDGAGNFEGWELQPHKLGEIWYDPCGGFAHRICKMDVRWRQFGKYRVVSQVSITKDDACFFCGCGIPVKERRYSDEEIQWWLDVKKQRYQLIAGSRNPTPAEVEEDKKGYFGCLDQYKCMYSNIPEYKTLVDLWINGAREQLLDQAGVVRVEAQDHFWGTHSGIPHPDDVSLDEFLTSIKKMTSYWHDFKNKYL